MIDPHFMQVVLVTVAVIAQLLKCGRGIISSSIISDSDARDSVLQRISAMVCGKGDVIISTHDVVKASKKQKCGKAIGMDGIAMEAFIHGGHRLHVHLSMMFNMFLRFGYVPESFMRSIIIPLKCKTCDLSDVNNYRAIAISTAVSNCLNVCYLNILKQMTILMHINLVLLLAVL